MGARFLDDAAHTAFKETVEEIESVSAAEVVVALRRSSANYLHANLIVGAAAAFAGLAAMLFAAYPFSLLAILIDPFLIGVVAGALVQLLPVVKRALTPATIRRRHVERAARATFLERGVHITLDRSGLLVYISWVERQVALIADANLEKAMTVEALREAEAELTAAMAHGGTAVARALAKHADAFTAAMPRRAGDLNELPDAIDSDLASDRKAPA